MHDEERAVFRLSGTISHALGCSLFVFLFAGLIFILGRIGKNTTYAHHFQFYQVCQFLTYSSSCNIITGCCYHWRSGTLSQPDARQEQLGAVVVCGLVNTSWWGQGTGVGPTQYLTLDLPSTSTQTQDGQKQTGEKRGFAALLYTWYIL